MCAFVDAQWLVKNLKALTALFNVKIKLMWRADFKKKNTKRKNDRKGLLETERWGERERESDREKQGGEGV